MTSPRLLDTNILLCYLTGDDPAMARRSFAPLTRVDGGNDMSEPPSSDRRGPRRCQATGDVMGATLGIWWRALALMLLLAAPPGSSRAGAPLAQGTHPPAPATPAGNIDGQRAEQIARQAMARA